VLRGIIDTEHATMSVKRQCELLGLPRSTYYYEAGKESEENLRLMRLIDEQFLRRPFFGSRKMALWLGQQGHEEKWLNTSVQKDCHFEAPCIAIWKQCRSSQIK